MFTRVIPKNTLHNKTNSKGLFFIIFFRVSSFFSKNIFLKILGFPVRLSYKFFVQWILGIDIPDSTKIGKSFCLYHGQGLIIHSSTIIGNNVTLRHNTTIGLSKEGGNCPVIGDYVEVGANSVIIGNINIGDNSLIAAGSVVIRDVPSNCIVAGNPARIVKYNLI